MGVSRTGKEVRAGGRLVLTSAQSDTKVLWTLSHHEAHPRVMECRQEKDRLGGPQHVIDGFLGLFGLRVPMGISASLDERGYEYTGLTLGLLPTPEFLKSATSQMEVRT